MTTIPIGKVHLVGAGPGDPELITLKGKRCLETADVILYDELVNRELMRFAPGNAELLYVGKKAGAKQLAWVSRTHAEQKTVCHYADNPIELNIPG